MQFRVFCLNHDSLDYVMNMIHFVYANLKDCCRRNAVGDHAKPEGNNYATTRDVYELRCCGFYPIFPLFFTDLIRIGLLLRFGLFLTQNQYVLQLFRNNSPFTVILLFIFALLVKFQVLLHPVAPLQVPGHFVYNYIIRGLSVIFMHGGFAFTMLAIVLLFIQSLYLKSIATRHKLFPRYTYIPAFVYLLLTSIYPPFSCFNETILLNWFLMGAVDIMFSFTQTSQPRKLIFNASFLLSMAALFQFTLLAFFFLLLVGMVMFRSFNLGEWSVALMGYITPLYFLACILFLADSEKPI